MAFMLVAVVLFFTLVGVFVLSVYYKNLHREALNIAESKTLTALTSLADSPEFYCHSMKPNCVDADKVIGLINAVNKTNYKNFWDFSSLKIIKASGFGKSEEDMIECNWQNYPDCDSLIIFSKEDKKIKYERTVSSFIALCRKEYENGYTYEKCEIAKLIAGTEIKENKK